MANQLPQGVVNIRGKQYETVALRVHKFREQFPHLSLVTDVLHRDELCVVMKAVISDENGRVLATGHAEEYRKASEINRTSALENAETSAIGRALAALGLGGTEFASADEVARAISGKKGDPVAASFKSSGTMGILETLTPDRQRVVREVANYVIDRVEADDVIAGWDEYDKFEDDERNALRGLLPSHVKTRLTKHHNELMAAFKESQKEAA